MAHRNLLITKQIAKASKPVKMTLFLKLKEKIVAYQTVQPLPQLQFDNFYDRYSVADRYKNEIKFKISN